MSQSRGDKMLRNSTGNDATGHSRGSIADMTSWGLKSVQEAFVLILCNLRRDMLTNRYVDYLCVFRNYVKDPCNFYLPLCLAAGLSD